MQWGSFVKIKKKNYLDDYIYVKELGKGAFGTVSKMKMKHTGLVRAAKIVKTTILLDTKEKFFAEISIPIKMDHPNIVKIFEVYEWKSKLCIIMELCEGGDLFQYIRNSKAFSEKKAASIAKEILSAVFYMHKNGVVHRDLKPDNMLYDKESKALKIIDFGTARNLAADAKISGLTGTLYYIAPEVLKGSYDFKCDIWSCGVILYILLSGAPPFNGKTEK